MSETTTLTKPANDLRGILSSDKFKEQIALALPTHMSPDRFARIALTALTRSPKLLECTKESVLKCCMDLSSFGLEPDGRHAHIIPYGKEATLVLDYKGLIALAKRSGEVRSWRAELVKEADEFTWDSGVVDHKVNWRADRGKTQCVYSQAILSDGSSDYEVMTLAEVEAIRKRSRAGTSGPWVTDFDEMAKKTVIRRHSKRLTLSPEFIAALAADGDRIEERPMRNVTPAPPVPAIALDLKRTKKTKEEPVASEPNAGAAEAFWKRCQDAEFTKATVVKYLIQSGHIADEGEELTDAEAAKVNWSSMEPEMF